MTNNCVFILFYNIVQINIYIIYAINYFNTFFKGKHNKRNDIFLYPVGLLFRSNIIIASVLVFLDCIKSPHSLNSNYWFHHHILCTSGQNLTNFYVKDFLYQKCKKAEIVGHKLHQSYLLRIWWTYKNWLIVCSKLHKALHRKEAHSRIIFVSYSSVSLIFLITEI